MLAEQGSLFASLKHAGLCSYYACRTNIGDLDHAFKLAIGEAAAIIREGGSVIERKRESGTLFLAADTPKNRQILADYQYPFEGHAGVVIED